MPVSAVQPGYSIIQQSSKMAEDAAREIQQNKAYNPVDITDKAMEFNKVELDKPRRNDPVDPLIKLNQSLQYGRIGTNVLQRDQDMIGSLLDISV
ncbi:hypothetical protein KW534_04005 [Vibrio fluvialis]|nr:hypothetical protein [Vibrio fluvialis]ELH7952873.1 hypothetical protein [Vibrio fluvialis]ELI1813017.1 hypothetical protein [Vibrio fluvialis]MBY8119481.1 hypothetical protein [Vibrio fluvialis]MBY8259718.1 hypothetical protein [Vibrio fluvialis]